MAKIVFKGVAFKKKSVDGTQTLYRPQARVYSTITSQEIIDYAVQNSNIEESVISQAMYGLESAIVNFLLNGHNIQFWPLGSLTTTIRCKHSKSKESAIMNTPTFLKTGRNGLQVHFVPSPYLKKHLSKKYISLVKG